MFVDDFENSITFEFLNKVLPKTILNNHNILSNGLYIRETLEQQIGVYWEEFCENNNYKKDPYPNFEFIYTTRLKFDRQKKINSCIFFLKMPGINNGNTSKELISAALIISENGEARFFILKELQNVFLPARFIKNNENFLLYEIDKHTDFINWGKLVNPRNLSHLSESIFFISQV